MPAFTTFADDVRAGLSADPKTLPPRYFYDEAGSKLFEAICDLPEYYPTDCEREIIRKALVDAQWNQTKAAKALHLKRSSLQYKMKKYHLQKK